jgi:hypothetical protein
MDTGRQLKGWDDVKHISVGCTEAAGWKVNYKCRKWLKYHEELFYEHCNCNNRFVLKNRGNGRDVCVRWK